MRNRWGKSHLFVLTERENATFAENLKLRAYEYFYYDVES